MAVRSKMPYSLLSGSCPANRPNLHPAPILGLLRGPPFSPSETRPTLPQPVHPLPYNKNISTHSAGVFLLDRGNSNTEAALSSGAQC